MPDEELFVGQPIRLTVSLEAIISREGVRALCDRCGEEIYNEREVRSSGVNPLQGLRREGLLYFCRKMIKTMAEKPIPPDPYQPLTEYTFAQGLLYLSEHDPDLARVLMDLGPPPMWLREPGFPTLVHIILEQQVSLASARAAFNRLVAAISPLTPERFLELDDVSLKVIGFSRQKTAYTRHLAELIVRGISTWIG